MTFESQTAKPSEPSMIGQRMETAVGEMLYGGLYGLTVYKTGCVCIFYKR